MAALLQKAPYNVPVWCIGGLTLMQLRTILLPEDLPILRRLHPPATSAKEAVSSGRPSPTGADRRALGSMSSYELKKKTEQHRFGLFDRVCDHLRKKPRELLTMRIEEVAQAFVEVSKLPIEKFPPDLLRQRIMEYVEAKG